MRPTSSTVKEDEGEAPDTKIYIRNGGDFTVVKSLLTIEEIAQAAERDVTPALLIVTAERRRKPLVIEMGLFEANGGGGVMNVDPPLICTAVRVHLLEDAVGASQSKTEMEEAPLFIAVNNECQEFAEILKTWGANQHECLVLEPIHKDATTSIDRNANPSTKEEASKSFDPHQRYVIRVMCFYAHCDEESRKVKDKVDQACSFATEPLNHKKLVEVVPPSMETDLPTCDGGDSKCLQSLSVDTKFSIHGTTCIGWVGDKFVIIGADSRVTSNDIELYTREKIKILTPCIVATHSGHGCETSASFEYMESKMNNDIRTGKDINAIWSLGELCLEKGLTGPDNIYHFLIGGIQNEVSKCCSVYDVKGLSGKEWVEVKAIGSGALAIGKMLEGARRKLGVTAPYEEVCFHVGYFLLLASLADRSTGGILTVYKVEKEGNIEYMRLTVIEALIKFYTFKLTFVLTLPDGGENDDTRHSFQELEGRMIFLVYRCAEIQQVKLEAWLSNGRKEKIRKYGHPLTELAAGYHTHRLEFKLRSQRDKFFKAAATIAEESTFGFTSKIELFRLYEIESFKMFVACQSFEMLESLQLSEKMKAKSLTRRCSV